MADRESRLGVHAALQILLQTDRKEKHSIFFLDTNTFIIKIKKNIDLSQAVGTFNSSSLFKVTH